MYLWGLAGECGVDSTGLGQELVAGCCGCDDVATQLVRSGYNPSCIQILAVLLAKGRGTLAENHRFIR
jgi:predicted nucleic acid-binding Zn finger protein